ncbi:LacI family DNA-binding transcriptional regulator [Agarivorans sp. MS3-6]|uniref:LacI family DNA-binding transcriptional regulator n=1 Tax=Agarivorans sp. TSD2052 TaxID=2937286 RepID=UPI00200D96A3|nr:LacI family DNA-binding transcriptional regulator [Agarivorans sp. TSD2052]UPW19535.1 LacI family DNA-binding transcriptional regulator [Agarivorans sp. TSD2052]
MITIKEVSELAKVSQATVSRAINGHSSVKEKNRVKVFDAIEQLGYKPNTFAQALASNRSNSIGMLVGSLDGPYFGPLMYNTENIIREQKLHLIVASGQESKTKEVDSIEFLSSKKVDGLIIHADKLSDNELIKITEDTPASIILNRNIPELADHCIWIDNELGGYLATKHLIENGHVKVACITGQMSKVESRDRLQGYRNALAEYGIPYDTNLVIEGRFDHEGNHETVHRLMARDSGFTAIFCQNDNIALAVYNVASDMKLTVGEDISIVGFDNDTYSQHIRPRLTTVSFPIEKMSNDAAHGVIALMNDQKYPIAGRLEPKLIVRDSVKPINP